MKIFANKDIKRLFVLIISVMFVFLVLTELIIYLFYKEFSLLIFSLSLLVAFVILAIYFWYFTKQNKIMEAAILEVNAYLSGDKNARIVCDNEGEMYKLFLNICQWIHERISIF